MINESSSKEVIVDLGKSIQNVFKKYSKINRERGWNVIQSSDGRKQIEKIINNPNLSLSGFQKLNFREWLDITKQI
jgi:hypothetical protein